MRKIVFKSGKELEIESISSSGESLTVTTTTEDANSLIETFSDKENTAVMRLYVGSDLIQGYAGYTKLKGLEFITGVVRNINYEVEDTTTESGFEEDAVNQCVVKLEKSGNQDATLANLEKNVRELQADFQEINEIMEG